MSEYSDADGEEIVRSSREFRLSKIDRKCDACRGAIPAGARYHRTALLYAGKWEVTARCERCQAIYEHLTRRIALAGDCDEYCNDRLSCGHDYRERWNEDPPPEIAALAFWLPGDPLPGGVGR